MGPVVAGDLSCICQTVLQLCQDRKTCRSGGRERIRAFVTGDTSLLPRIRGLGACRIQVGGAGAVTVVKPRCSAAAGVSFRSLNRRSQKVIRVANDVAVALLGQEALPVRGVFGVQAVAGHHRVEDGAAAVGLRAQ